MAYIGLEPSNSFVSLKRQVITGDGTASYTLDHSVASVNDVAIFVNNVRQDPAGYSISGAALTLGGTIESSDDCYVIFLGQALQTVTPGAATVTGSMLNNSLISDKTALSATPADTDELLISDAGTLKRIDYSLIKPTNTPAFKAIMSSGQSISANTVTVVQINSEVFDIGGYFNTSNYRFTPPAGKYCFIGNLGNGEYETYLEVSILKNGSKVSENIIELNSGTWAGRSPVHAVEEANGSDYFELGVRAGSGMTILSNNYRTFFSAFKIIE